MEIRAASASAKLRQSNRTDDRIELTIQLFHSCWTYVTFARRTTDSKKTANLKYYLSGFWWPQAATRSCITVTFGLTINYPLYDAIHEKPRLHKSASSGCAQNSPKAQLYSLAILNAWTSIPVQTVLFELEMQCTKILQLLRHRCRNNSPNPKYYGHGWLMKYCRSI